MCFSSESSSLIRCFLQEVWQFIQLMNLGYRETDTYCVIPYPHKYLEYIFYLSVRMKTKSYSSLFWWCINSFGGRTEQSHNHNHTHIQKHTNYTFLSFKTKVYLSWWKSSFLKSNLKGLNINIFSLNH